MAKRRARRKAAKRKPKRRATRSATRRTARRKPVRRTRAVRRKTTYHKQDKEAIAWLVGALGVIFLLAGIFTPLEFMYGILLAIIFWIGAGFLKRYWGIKGK